MHEKLWQPVLLFYAKATGWIALPIVLASVFSKNLPDAGRIAAFVVAFLISIWGIYREIKKYQKDINNTENKNGDK